MPDEEKSEESQLKIPDVLPVLALRDIVVFPFMIVPLFVSRDRSIKAVDQSSIRKPAHSSRITEGNGAGRTCRQGSLSDGNRGHHHAHAEAA